MLRNHSTHLHTMYFGILIPLLVVLILHSEEKRVATQLHLCKKQHCCVLQIQILSVCRNRHNQFRYLHE